MSTFYFAENLQGEYIFSNFPENLLILISSYKEGQSTIQVEINNVNTTARLGKRSNKFGNIYVLTTDARYVNRFKLFKELLQISLCALEPLAKYKDDLKNEKNSETQELVHNLTSINAYSIQDIQSLISTQVLSENINKQRDIVKGIILNSPNLTVNTLLKQIRYNFAMKVEFSVFEKTLKKYPDSQRIQYPIRNAILSILQIFIDEFDNKKIAIHLDATERILVIDYDALFVSLYYIFENATKYCSPNSKFIVRFEEENDGYTVVFSMVSIRIEPNELNSLFIKEYRGSNAKKINNSGNGIGMYRIKKTLKLNDAELTVIPRANSHVVDRNNIRYEVNEFRLKFKGQQDWFKINKL